MRILFVVHHYPPEPVLGYERFAVALTTGLAGRGHEVAVIARRPATLAAAEGLIDGVAVRRYTPRVVPGALWMFGRAISNRGVRPLLEEYDGRFDVIVGPPPYVDFAARWAPGAKRVYAAGGTLCGSGRWDVPAQEGATLKMRLFNRLSRWQLARVERRTIRAAQRIGVPSRSVARQLAEYYGVDAARVAVIPHGVEASRFVPARRRPDGTLRILSVGRLDAVKNHRLLLEALALARGREKMTLRLVGGGLLGEVLKARAAELKIDRQVEFVGQSSEVERHCQWGDVFVLPSRYEAFGIVLLEAMSCGLPCVALRSDPPRIWTANEEIIADGETGLLIERDDPTLLAGALDRFLDEPDLGRAMGQAARARAEIFSWDRAVAGYERLFDELLKDEPGT